MTLCQNVPRSSSKRGVDVLDAADERLSKKKRITYADEDDMDWIKREMGDIKEGVKEIAEHLRGDVDCKLEEVLAYVRELAGP